jgi:hypothetical protein
MNTNEAKQLLKEYRDRIENLKFRHERTAKLNGATNAIRRSILSVQDEVTRIKRRFPALPSSWHDDFRPPVVQAKEK